VGILLDVYRCLRPYGADSFRAETTGAPPSLLRILGETISISFGGVGLVSGLLFGMFCLEKGVDIPKEQHCREPNPYLEQCVLILDCG
jgi:hypothetical protein